MMKSLFPIMGMVLVVALWGCAVIDPEPDGQVQPLPPFDQLIQAPDRYVGEFVVLGGYVLSVDNLKDHSRMIALQAPLGSGQRPKARDLSMGRLVLLYNGFWDPEVFTKDRRITVGGHILDPISDSPPKYPYLRIQVSDMHLWPVEKSAPMDPYWNDPFCFYPWWPYPYAWRYHRWGHRPWCD